MDAKKVFFWAWFWLDVLITLVMAIALIVICYNVGYWVSLFSLFLPSLVVGKLYWDSGISIPTGIERIYEWRGKAMEPLVPGWYHPFKYFGFLKPDEVDVPMNIQTLYILTGTRDGLSSDDFELFYYGTQSDIEPGTGAALRLKYKVDFECVDSIKLRYKHNDPYTYIAGLVESKVNIYVHGLKSEEIIDNFTKTDWHKTLVSDVETESQLINHLGVRLISFIPIDVILSVKAEEWRQLEDAEERKGKIMKIAINNEVMAEVEKKRILNAQLVNSKKVKELAVINNKIEVDFINDIKNEVGVNSVMALKYAMHKNTLKTVTEASKNSEFAYIDGSGSGDNTIAQAAKISMGFRTAGSAPVK